MYAHNEAIFPRRRREGKGKGGRHAISPFPKPVCLQLPPWPTLSGWDISCHQDEETSSTYDNVTTISCEKKKFIASDGLQIQWIILAILCYTDRNTTSRIKQAVATDRPSPKGNTDKIKDHSEDGSLRLVVSETHAPKNLVEISEMFSLCHTAAWSSLS